MCIPLTWRDNLLITDSCQWSQHASNSTSVHFYYQGCLCINNFYYQRCRCINTLLLSRLYLHQYTSISKAVSTSIHFYYQDCLYFYYQGWPLFIKTFSGISSWISSKLHVFPLIFPLKTSTYPLTTSQKKLYLSPWFWYQ